MKKVFSAALIASALAMTGCATAPFQPGLLYSGQSLPVDAENNATSCAKKGTGTATNLLGLIATGDASIATAKKNAGIKKIDTVDIQHTSILGLFSTTVIEVCGE